jgi:hypothetical protein
MKMLAKKAQIIEMIFFDFGQTIPSKSSPLKISKQKVVTNQPWHGGPTVPICFIRRRPLTFSFSVTTGFLVFLATPQEHFFEDGGGKKKKSRKHQAAKCQQSQSLVPSKLSSFCFFRLGQSKNQNPQSLDWSDWPISKSGNKKMVPVIQTILGLL